MMRAVQPMCNEEQHVLRAVYTSARNVSYSISSAYAMACFAQHVLCVLTLMMPSSKREPGAFVSVMFFSGVLQIARWSLRCSVSHAEVTSADESAASAAVAIRGVRITA